MNPDDLLPQPPEVPEVFHLTDLPFPFVLPWALHLLWGVVAVGAVIVVVLAVQRRLRAAREEVRPLLERARRARGKRADGEGVD